VLIVFVSWLESAKAVCKLVIVFWASYNFIWVRLTSAFVSWFSKEIDANCSEFVFVLLSKRVMSSVT
jgi:hypothetical protein